MGYTFYTRLKLIIPNMYDRYRSKFTYVLRVYDNENTTKPSKVIEGAFNNSWETKDEKITVMNEATAKAMVIRYDIYCSGKITHFDIIGKRLYNPRTKDTTCTNFIFDTSKAITVGKVKATKPQEVKRKCTHINGAIHVAKYIVEEIKRNVRSKEVERIRTSLSNHQRDIHQWSRMPNSPYPSANFAIATKLWYDLVATGHIWDHKPIIKNKFNKYAVHRPLTSGTWSESYYHEYRGIDYFYDVWSNIHYGHVGLSAGFDQDYLSLGSSIEQVNANFRGLEPPDDKETMKIGYNFYKKFGKYAEKLTYQHVLNELEKAELLSTKFRHLCVDKARSA